MASASFGARVNEPNIVTLSRTRKMDVAARAAPRLLTSAALTASVLDGAARVPKIWAKRISFHTPIGTLTSVVVANVIKPGEGAFISRLIVSVALATMYVAVYKAQMIPNGA